jgi:hypothetical protein
MAKLNLKKCKWVLSLTDGDGVVQRVDRSDKLEDHLSMIFAPDIMGCSPILSLEYSAKAGVYHAELMTTLALPLKFNNADGTESEINIPVPKVQELNDFVESNQIPKIVLHPELRTPDPVMQTIDWTDIIEARRKKD